MSQLLPAPPDRGADDGSHTTILEPELTREQRLARWGLQAGRWRAVELAEAVFGPGVRSRLAAMTPEGVFGGLLHLDVCYTNLDEHRAREETFVAAVGSDPLLAGHRFVFVFGALGEGVAPGAPVATSPPTVPAG